MSMLSKVRFLSFIFLIGLIGAIVPHSVAQEATQPLDIILLLDSSGSTIYQRALIEKAAEFLLDYLEANAEFAGLDYRLSVVGFNQDIIAGSALSLGRPSEANLAKFFEDTPAGGDTDFKPALNFALDEFIRLNSLESGRVPVVILMTDGQPARGGEVLSDPELVTYFSGLEEMVTTIGDTGIRIFVVGVGDAEGDQDSWQNILQAEEQYAYIDDSSNLSEVYWQFLSEFIGGEQNEATSLVNGEAEVVSVEPYLDELTFTILKDAPESEVIIEDPAGNLYTQLPIRGGGETDLHEIYIIPTPDDGEWKITLQGSDGRLLVNRRYPKVSLVTDNQAVSINAPFLVQAIIESDSLKHAEDLTLRLVNDVENYEEAAINLLFEPVINGLLYEVTVPGLAEPDVYDLAPIVLINGELFPSVQVEGVSVKAVALPRIVRLNVVQETPDEPFVIEYDIENDEDIQNLNPELQITVDGQPVIVENLTDHETEGENTYSKFTPKDEGEYVITLHIEGTSSDGLNFADTFKVTVTFFLPTPIPVPVPTSAPSPTATQSVVPEVTEQPVQPLPPPNQESPNVLLFLTFLLLLILVVLVGWGVYMFYKKGRGTEGRKSEPDPHDPSPTSSGRTDKTINESLDEMGDSTSFADKDRLEDLVAQRLRNVDQDAGGATRDVIAALSKLEEMYGDDYYEQYVRPMLDQLRGAEVQVFLRALSFGLIKQWKEDRNVERVVSIMYDKILGLTSNPHVTFVKVAEALESEATEPILKEFLANWVRFYRNPDQGSYKTMADLDVGYVDSLRQVYRLLYSANSNRFSYGNGSEYKQLQDSFLPQEGVYKSQNLYLLLKDLNPVFTQPPPKELEAWQEYKSVLEQAAKDLTSSDKTYTKIPETHILRNQVNRWLASTQTRIENWAEEPVAIGPGKIEFELRSSLDVHVDQEETVRNNDWTYYIRGVLYHISGADINHLRVLYSANKQRAISVTFDKPKENIKLASGEHIKFAIVQEPVEPTKLSFELEFQTLFTVGNTNELRQYQERISSILNIAPSLDSYLLEQELKSPFIVNRPLKPEEFKRFALRRPTQIAIELVEYLTYSEGTELVVLEGLRQSGKTTIIDAVLETIDPNPMNGLPKYFIVKVNLMEWWREYIEGQGITNADSYRHQFWRCCYHYGVEKLAKFNEQENQDLMDSSINSQDTNGANPFFSFKTLAMNLKNKTGLLPLLIVDDADVFHEFGNQIPKLMEELNSFCQSSQGIIWTANDNRSRPWIETLQTLFRDNRQAKQKTFRTTFVDERDVEKILTINETLALTPLAKRAAYIFTGGWVSLVQELGNGLVNEIINPRVGVEYEQAYRLITVQDIRSVILQYSLVNTIFVNYLRASFTDCEVLLMQVMVKENLIDKDTGILEGIQYKSGWTGKEFLREKVQQAYRSEEISKEDIEFLEKNWQGIFYQLKEKGIIENLVFQGQLSSLVRFRVGLLYSYFSNQPYTRCVSSSGLRIKDE